MFGQHCSGLLGIVCNYGKRFVAWSVLRGYKSSVEYVLPFRYTKALFLTVQLQVVDTINPLPLGEVGQLITQTIDFEQSVERGRTAVKHGVDAALDEVKRSYMGMENFLSSVITKLQEQIPEWARQYVQNCTFMPQLGFLTVISLNPDTKESNYNGEGLHEPWELMFAAEGSVYYKNRQMREMDEQLGDAYCMIIGKPARASPGCRVLINLQIARPKSFMNYP